MPLTALAARYPTMLSIVAGGEAALATVAALAERIGDPAAGFEAHARAPIERPRKYLANGKN